MEISSIVFDVDNLGRKESAIFCWARETPLSVEIFLVDHFEKRKSGVFVYYKKIYVAFQLYK